ncbi:MAG: TonB C-terminal domain-containing protein [Desulfobulbaceae bacterium]|nr:TonB C-terminal domain-containing protein [Desulfobulbaceae bacterium]
MSIMIDTPGAHGGFSLGQYPEEQRKKPLILTLSVHFIIFIFMLIPPDFFQANRNLDEIYTVDLFETVESAPTPQVQPQPQKKVVPPPIEPVVEKKVAPATSLQPVESPPGEIISLKPRVVKKDRRTKKDNKIAEQKVNTALDRIKKQLSRQEALQKAKQVEAAAAAVAENAVDKLRDILHAEQSISPAAGTTTSSSSAGSNGGKSSSDLDEASKLYFVAVQQQIQANWILPELQEWKNNLKAVVVVNVRRDGIVKKYFFERKSDNIYFNQFVEKTLNESLPLPPFPQGLKDDSIEFGLVFHPGGLQ